MSYQIRDLPKEFEGTCDRQGCEDEATKNISTVTPMEPTDRDEPAPTMDSEELKIVPVCEACADEYNRNLAYSEGPSSVNGFLATEK